jgi:hypothetical protein
MSMSLLSVFKIIVVSSIFFVWVVRYDNIIKEFKEYSLPDWLRDLVGILKLSFAFMIMNGDVTVVAIGAVGIATLMLAAQVMHIRVSNSFSKMLPSLCLLLFCLFIGAKSLALI